jgi:cellulose synthase/poly-beta-1,6-N-acetylglucosamine synthase-like glycosyltransferase
MILHINTYRQVLVFDMRHVRPSTSHTIHNIYIYTSVYEILIYWYYIKYVILFILYHLFYILFIFLLLSLLFLYIYISVHTCVFSRQFMFKDSAGVPKCEHQRLMRGRARHSFSMKHMPLPKMPPG